MLAKALAKMQCHQQSKRELEDNLEMQGTKRKMGEDMHNHKFWTATVSQPHVMLTINEALPYLHCLHLVMRFDAGGRGKLVAVEEDRDKEAIHEVVALKD